MKYVEKPFNSKRSAIRCAKVTAITLFLGIILLLLKSNIGIFVVVVGVIIPVLFCLLRKYPKERVPEFVGRMGLIRYNSTFEPFYIDFENRLWCFGYPDEVGVCGTFGEIGSVKIFDEVSDDGIPSIGVEITMTDGEKLVVDFVTEDADAYRKEYAEARELAKEFEKILLSIIADPNQWKARTYSYSDLAELSQKVIVEYNKLIKTCTTANLKSEAERLYKRYHISPNASENRFMPYLFSDELVVRDVVRDFYHEETIFGTKTKMQYLIHYETPPTHPLTLREYVRGVSADTPPPPLKRGEKRFVEGRITAFHSENAYAVYFSIFTNHQ